jgi:hypothetical protein
MMKKLTLNLRAGSAPGSSSFTPSPVTIEFIFGAGSSGLTPFEVALNGVQVAERISLQLLSSELGPYFGHHYPPIREKLGLLIIPETLFLEVELTDQTEPSAREVVQYMAKSMSSGGCGCGDGCTC